MNNSFPEPQLAEIEQSTLLSNSVRQHMAAQGGQISFAEFMHEVLYSPGLGYYSGNKWKFGEQGDFTTAPELSPLFGQCLMRQCQEILSNLNSGDLLEFGAGSGALASEILMGLNASQCLPEHYYIVEVSTDLKALQQETLEQRCPELLSRVVWLDNMPQNLKGVVIANEVLDAMPAHVFSIKDEEQYELYVAYKDDRFIWQLGELSNPQLSQRINKIRQHLDSDVVAEGYLSEINLAAEHWLSQLASCLSQGVILLCDYGFPFHEYYHRDRSQGTLMCHYKHHCHSDPFYLPGMQDITTHVDFSSMAEVGINHGLQLKGFQNQALFLLGCGLTEIIDGSDTATNHQVNQLTSPAEMGELMKMLVFAKNYPDDLCGFQFGNKQDRL